MKVGLIVKDREGNVIKCESLYDIIKGIRDNIIILSSGLGDEVENLIINNYIITDKVKQVLGDIENEEDFLWEYRGMPKTIDMTFNNENGNNGFTVKCNKCGEEEYRESISFKSKDDSYIFCKNCGNSMQVTLEK